jgi:hypothetical protein
MESPNTDSTAENSHSVGLCAILALAALAVSASAVALEDPPPGEDAVATAAESAVEGDDDTRRAEGVSRRDQRRHRKAGDADATQGSDRPVPIVLPGHAEAQIVCRSYRRLGTRIDRRVCATAAEWASREAAGEKDAERFMRQMREASAIAPAGGTTPGRTPL